MDGNLERLFLVLDWTSKNDPLDVPPASKAILVVDDPKDENGAGEGWVKQESVGIAM